WKRPQINAANYRFAAEVGRSILATWSIPESAAKLVRGLPQEFAHFGRNLVLHQRFDPDEHSNGFVNDVNKLAIDYVDDRIAPQIDYYSDKREKAKCLARALEIGSIIFSFTAVVSAGFLAFAHGTEFQRALWAFAKLVAATAVPVAVSVLVIHEVKRREARYEEMENSLQRHG